MNLDRRTIILIALSIFGFSAYNYYLQSKYPDHFTRRPIVEEEVIQPSQSETVVREGKGATLDQADPSAVPAEETIPQVEAEPIRRLSAEELTFENDVRRLVFNQDFSAIASVELKKYRREAKKDQPVELLDAPLLLQATINPMDLQGRRGDYSAEREGNTLRFKRQQGDFLLVQEFIVPEEGYLVELKTHFTNVGSQSQELTAGILAQQNVLIPSGGSSWGPAAFVAQNKSFTYGRAGERNEEIAKGYCEDPDGPVFSLRNEQLDYIGFDWHYFLAVLRPLSQLNFDMERTNERQMGPYCPMSLVGYQRYGIVEPGQTVTLEFEAYFGPKDVNVLEEANPALASTVKFGWFSIIAHPLLWALKFFYGIFLNYGIAIITVTVILKLLFYPLTRAAAISMKKMQKLQPEMTQIREKYKEDPQRMQRELMAFMSKNKVNPAKGCLPILPQIPVFIAFYNVLSQAIELRHAPFFGWIQDLSAADPYYISPILLGVGMFVQQKLTPNPSLDKNQEKIMLMLPIIFTVMMLSLPAGMVLYMLANTAVSIVQQQWLNKRMEKQFG
ncbi:MAG: membrane protein insertase YidC [Oligoflexus sp.]